MKNNHFSLLWKSRQHNAPDAAAIMEVERKNILSEKSDFSSASPIRPCGPT